MSIAERSRFEHFPIPARLEKLPMDAAFAPRPCHEISGCFPTFVVACFLGVLLAAGMCASAAESPPSKDKTAGYVEVTCAGQPVRNRSWSACGFTLLADAGGPQVAVMQPAGAMAVCVRA